MSVHELGNHPGGHRASSDVSHDKSSWALLAIILQVKSGTESLGTRVPICPQGVVTPRASAVGVSGILIPHSAKMGVAYLIYLHVFVLTSGYTCLLSLVPTLSGAWE